MNKDMVTLEKEEDEKLKNKIEKKEMIQEIDTICDYKVFVFKNDEKVSKKKRVDGVYSIVEQGYGIEKEIELGGDIIIICTKKK